MREGLSSAIPPRMDLKANRAVETGEEMTFDFVKMYETCDWSGEGDVPENCSIGGAPREKFPSFREECVFGSGTRREEWR